MINKDTFYSNKIHGKNVLLKTMKGTLNHHSITPTQFPWMSNLDEPVIKFWVDDVGFH